MEISPQVPASVSEQNKSSFKDVIKSVAEIGAEKNAEKPDKKSWLRVRYEKARDGVKKVSADIRNAIRTAGDIKEGLKTSEGRDVLKQYTKDELSQPTMGTEAVAGAGEAMKELFNESKGVIKDELSKTTMRTEAIKGASEGVKELYKESKEGLKVAIEDINNKKNQWMENRVNGFHSGADSLSKAVVEGLHSSAIKIADISVDGVAYVDDKVDDLKRGLKVTEVKSKEYFYRGVAATLESPGVVTEKAINTANAVRENMSEPTMRKDALGDAGEVMKDLFGEAKLGFKDIVNKIGAGFRKGASACRAEGVKCSMRANELRAERPHVEKDAVVKVDNRSEVGAGMRVNAA